MNPKNCLRVGITGGIGSGKTTVCKLFEALGIPIYYADDMAKSLMVGDPELRHQITQLIGAEAYTTDGLLDRAYLAKVIFEDTSKRLAINALVHPAVRTHGANWHTAMCKKGAPFTIKEAALLIESGSYKDLDLLILVTAPQMLRITRVQARDGHSRKAIIQRMRAQLPDKDRRPYAQIVIDNSGKKPLIPQVWAAFQLIMNDKQ
jgi:dephospho-CoA kinase